MTAAINDASRDEAAWAVRVLQNLATLPGLHYSALAAFTGNSPTTIRAVLLTGQLPKREHARRTLVEFARRNATARERRDLVIV